MSGEITQPKRPRYQSNERFDTVDANAASLAPRDHDDALTRAVLSTPRNVAAVPVGLILSGFSLLPNPTAGNDGLVRINAETGVAFDSNGRTIIKPTGTTLDISIPVGTHQIYVYYVENATDVAKRRFLPVVPPFVEYTQAIDTAFQGGIGTFLRVGGLVSAVPSDVVNGATTSLCLIGIATNTGAGAITITGWNAVTAPNGTDIINRLSTVAPPTLVPPSNAAGGSPKTIHDLITAVLYTAGLSAWKGSDFLTPAAANNYGAYNIPAGGVDKAYRQALGYVTIGNGTTIIGDFNTSDYANNKLMLDAALASLPASGGKLILKHGVALTGFGGLTVTMPAKYVEIVGNNSATGITPPTPQITFAAGEKFICDVNNLFVLRDVAVQHIDTAVTLTNTAFGGFRAYNCFFTKPNSADSGGALQGVNVWNLTLEDVIFYTTVNAQYTNNAMAIRITGVGQNIDLRRVHHAFGGDEAQSLSIADVRDNFTIDGYTVEDDGGGFSPTAFDGQVMNLATTTNTDVRNRVIKNYRVYGNFWSALRTSTVSEITIDGMQTVDTWMAVENTTVVPSTGTLAFKNCTWKCGLAVDSGFVAHYPTTGGAMGIITFDNCQFIRTGAAYTESESLNILSGANFSIQRVRISDCTFSGSKRESFQQTLININASGASGMIREVIIERCHFEDFQNAPYIGAAGFSALIGVFCTRCESLIVRDNTTYKIMSGTSGNSRDQTYLLSTGFTGFAGYYNLVQVTGNRLGGFVGSTPDQCGLWVNTDQNIQLADISRNHVRISWDTNVGTAKWVDGSVQRITSTSNTFGSMKSLKFDGNEIEIVNNTGDTLTKNLYFLDNTGTANVLGNSIQDNNVYITSADKFDYVAAWGFNIPSYTHYNLAVAGNNCYCGDPPFLPDAIRLRFTGAVTNQFNDVTPGAGVQIPGNNGLYGNA